MGNDSKRAPIGIFDSGLGGLTVAKEITLTLPKEELVYFGDTARVPYGNKSKETILRFATQIVNFLETKKVKAIVMACNTASALALEEMRKQTEIPIIGVIEPGSLAAVRTTKNKKIGVIGTKATVGSGIYPKIIKKLDSEIEVLCKACPLLVPLVEEGLTRTKLAKETISYYLEMFKKSEVDSLILGCTHYPHLRESIGEYLGKDITLVNPAFETALELKDLLEEKNLLREEEGRGHEFYVSDLPEEFQEFANGVMPFEVPKTNKIDIERY